MLIKTCVHVDFYHSYGSYCTPTGVAAEHGHLSASHCDAVSSYHWAVTSRGCLVLVVLLEGASQYAGAHQIFNATCGWGHCVAISPQVYNGALGLL